MFPATAPAIVARGWCLGLTAAAQCQIWVGAFVEAR